MPFSEQTKLTAKRKSNFRCVVCGEPFVEVHHIKPQHEGGDDTLDNAVPLCARCHDLFGENPAKRKQIREMRDHYYQQVESMTASGILDRGLSDSAYTALESEKVAIYHVVYEDEDFDTSACILMDLAAEAQRAHPGKKRVLYLDIDGHRNPAGGFDRDMLELQKEFLIFLMQYISEAHTPLIPLKNSRPQHDDLPDQLFVQDGDRGIIRYLGDDAKTLITMAKQEEKPIE